MKRYSALMILTLGLAVSAMGAQDVKSPADPRTGFAGGCGLIVATMVRLAWKTRRLGK
jgi:hypothetical protein